ncbi:MAG: hypothetical protein Q4E91_12485 [Lachnospiraceae bacterium]|nr:hypothetical protein [Lachnospiraceae bacterium]
MPTPPKPAKVLEMEKRSHRTKKEIAQRKKAEAGLLTGVTLKEKKEVRENQTAHREFLRLKKLLKTIEKDDDLYGETINRYCILIAECEDFQQKRERMYQQLCDFQNHMNELVEREEMSWKEAYSLEATMQRGLISMDKQVQTKRRMLLDMEKENIMTIASSLRSVPKKTESKKNALKEALSSG